jgi:nanoRNase/pAp phosphatase (c-di-AMP/oligoRNAs hydrolase)
MVYHFIEAMNDENLVNNDIAECLYTGIMTDTGGFDSVLQVQPRTELLPISSKTEQILQ